MRQVGRQTGRQAGTACCSVNSGVEQSPDRLFSVAEKKKSAGYMKNLVEESCQVAVAMVAIPVQDFQLAQKRMVSS